MAIKIISNDLLQFVVRGSFLEPLVEIMPQVLVESAPGECLERLYAQSRRILFGIVPIVR